MVLQKQSAIDKADSDWVLLLDADEFIDMAAAEIIRDAVASDCCGCLSLTASGMVVLAMAAFADATQLAVTSV